MLGYFLDHLFARKSNDLKARLSDRDVGVAYVFCSRESGVCMVRPNARRMSSSFANFSVLVIFIEFRQLALSDRWTIWLSLDGTLGWC